MSNSKSSYSENGSFSETGNNGSSSLPRKRTRVARILKDSINFPKSAPQEVKKSQDQKRTNFPNLLQSTKVPLMGRVINGHITFNLFPKIPKLYCPFSFKHSPGHNVVIVFYPGVTIPYILNGIPNIYNGTEVDITEQLKDGENYLIINTTAINQEVLASIEWRNPDTIEDIVQEIINEKQMEIPPMMNIITDECPLGKKQIVVPGRGSECQHCQCFDLSTFIKYGQSTGDWKCPICGKLLSIDSLRYDPSFLKNCGTLFLGDEFTEDANSFF